jgi:hypothetical protein
VRRWRRRNYKGQTQTPMKGLYLCSNIKFLENYRNLQFGYSYIDSHQRKRFDGFYRFKILTVPYAPQRDELLAWIKADVEDGIAKY